jgi:hypothetical protein
MTRWQRELDSLWREMGTYLAFYSEVPRPKVPAPRLTLAERLSDYSMVGAEWDYRALRRLFNDLGF